MTSDTDDRETTPGTLRHAIPVAAGEGTDLAVYDTVRMYSGMVREACTDMPQDTQPADVYPVAIPERTAG